jgi:integrase
VARLRRHGKLQTREARTRLAQSVHPYWHTIQTGLALGYYKGDHAGSWYVRRRVASRYRVERLSDADDFADADGVTVLDFAQAQRRALLDESSKAAADHPDKYTVADALRDWQAKQQAQSRDSSMAPPAAAQVRLIAEGLGATAVAALTTRMIEIWRDGIANSGRRVRQKAPKVPAKPAPVRFAPPPKGVTTREAKRRRQATANRLLNVLKAALNYAWRAGLAPSDAAWRRVSRFAKVDKPRLRFLSVEECKRLLAACAPDFKTLVQAALFTGLRLGELWALRVGDVREATVFAGETKSGTPRTVPLNAEGTAFFNALSADQPRGTPLFRQANGDAWNKMRISRLMREVSATTKLDPPATFHDLRRSYASLLINAGAGGETIQKLLGHADLRMTLRVYAHLLDTRIADQVRTKLPSFEESLSDTTPPTAARV